MISESYSEMIRGVFSKCYCILKILYSVCVLYCSDTVCMCIFVIKIDFRKIEAIKRERSYEKTYRSVTKL